MTTAPLVLAVDDEIGTLKLIRLGLGIQGFQVLAASNGEEALRLAEEQRPDIVVLDILMPDVSGLETMRRLREHSNTPIILLTAKGTENDKVSGLEMGADDYLVKPFSPEELAARIRAVLRRSALSQGTYGVVRVDEVEIDLENRLVKREGETIAMTRNEWLLLQALATHAGKVMLNAELLTKVWGPEYRDDLQYLRVWVSRLRHKLEKDPSNPVIIRTMQGIGYILATGETGESPSSSPAEPG